ncbi:MAG: ankyrin repeat domain-containing protein [Parachlamydiales bacterium]
MDINQYFQWAASGSLFQLAELPSPRQHLETPNEEGETLLFVAAKAGNRDIVEYLLARGADPNARTTYWENAPKFSLISLAIKGKQKLWEGGQEEDEVVVPCSWTSSELSQGVTQVLETKDIEPLIVTYRPEGIDSWQSSSAHPSLPRSKDLASSRCSLSDDHLSRPLDDRSQSGVEEPSQVRMVKRPHLPTPQSLSSPSFTQSNHDPSPNSKSSAEVKRHKEDSLTQRELDFIFGPLPTQDDPEDSDYDPKGLA